MSNRSRPLRFEDVRIMVWSGLLGGLLLFHAFNLISSPPQSLYTEPGASPWTGEGGATVSPTSVRVIDGDTFDHAGERIRIADIDTPELRGKCAEEVALARAARARLRALLAEGPFELRRLGRDEDRYGRKLRVVLRGGESIGDRLVAEGLARTWSGRREPWC